MALVWLHWFLALIQGHASVIIAFAALAAVAGLLLLIWDLRRQVDRLSRTVTRQVDTIGGRVDGHQAHLRHQNAVQCKHERLLDVHATDQHNLGRRITALERGETGDSTQPVKMQRPMVLISRPEPPVLHQEKSA